jgi:hypothetical protein
MRRSLLFSVVLLGSLAVAVACGSSSGSGGSSGGGPDDGSPGEGGSSGGDDGSSGGGDGSSSGSDGPAGPFCASLTPKPKLCADFDDGKTPAIATTQTGAAAAQGIDATFSKSPPNSYKIDVPALPPQISYALLEMALDTPTPPTKFIVSFDFRPDAAPAASGTLVVARVFLSQTHSVSIEPTSENGPVIREQEGGPPPTLDRPSAKFARLPGAGAWTRYELTIDLAGGIGKTATLKADGLVVATLALTGTTNSDYFALNLGLQADAAFTARYDNLVVDY